MRGNCRLPARGEHRQRRRAGDLGCKVSEVPFVDLRRSTGFPGEKICSDLAVDRQKAPEPGISALSGALSRWGAAVYRPYCNDAAGPGGYVAGERARGLQAGAADRCVHRQAAFLHRGCWWEAEDRRRGRKLLAMSDNRARISCWTSMSRSPVDIMELLAVWLAV